MADYLGKKIKFNIEDNDLQKIRFNKVYGESQQATRSGKNLYNVLDTVAVTEGITVDEDGWITVTYDNIEGTATKFFNYFTNNLNLKTSTNYNVIAEVKNVSGTGNINFVSVNENAKQFQSTFNKNFSVLANNTIYNSINKTADEFVGNSGLRTYIGFSTGQSGSITFRLSVLEDTTVTPENFEYEAFGIMPSADYPSEIENIEGKNKFSGFVKGIAINATDGHQLADETRATSDYIAVDFNKNPNYYLSGLANTLQTFVAAYNSNKEFLGRTGALLVSYFSLNSSSFILGTAQGTGDIAYLRVTTYENTSSGTTGAIDDVDNLETQLEGGTVATDYVPYNSLEFKDEGKNKFDCANSRIIYNNSNAASYERLENGLKLISGGSQYSMIYFLVDTVKNLKDKTLTLSSDISFSKDNQLTTFGLFYTDINGGNRTTLVTNNNVTSEGKYQVTGQVEEGENRDYVCIGLRPNMASNYASGDYTIYDNLQVEIGEIATPYTPYQERKEYFPLSEGQKLMKGSYLADDGIHHRRKQVVFDGSREYIRYTSLDSANYNCFYTNQSDIYVDSTGTQTCLMSNYFKGDKFDNRALDIPNMWVNKFSSQIYFKVPNTITTVEELTTLFAEQYANGTPVIVEYELAEEEIVPYTETQQEAREKLRHFKGLNGENNITAQGTMTSTLDLTLYNVAEEDFDIYISKKGYFGALKYDINNLIDFMESNIPSIAEATESSVKIAGRDGDISLNTVYEPLPFEIVCYTEDNLTPEEKIIEEQKITSLLNSIKNQTKTFFMEREKKFYKVKYSGNLSVVRYPKHLKFTIPLKSSESYAMNFEESEIIGNGTKVSNTIKDTGAIFTIKGPATKPIISLNNYQMKYNENILEGNSLIINSEDSTITHITSAGVKTNAMRAYNHEFPKIKNGENQLAVSSGIDDEKQVNVKWYDLKI